MTILYAQSSNGFDLWTIKTFDPKLLEMQM